MAPKINPKLGSDSKSEPEDADKDARARRREQVRRAQRTHRDRKATYVKALELEVAKLRSKDVTYDIEIRTCKETIRRLRDLLLSNNIQIPHDLPHIHIDSPLAMIEVLGRPNETQSLRAHMPVFDATAPHPFQRGSISSPEAAQPPLPTSTQGESSSSTYALAPPTNPPKSFEPMNLDVPDHDSNPHGLGATQVGVDFVLALEQPCLYHHQLPNTQLDQMPGAGHSMMLLAPIMSRSPPIDVRRKGPETSYSLPSGAKWNVPAIELEKLLAISNDLDLDGELTPVQVWQRIRQHPQFGVLTQTGLETLRESLLTVVQCYGFGAVIDEAYFEQMLDQTFGTA